MNRNGKVRSSFRKVRMGSLSVVASMLLLFTMVVPANAASFQNGSRSCSPPTQFSWITGKTKGASQMIMPPGTGAEHWRYNLSTTAWTSTTKQGITSGGYWEVASINLVDTAATKVWCASYT